LPSHRCVMTDAIATAPQTEIRRARIAVSAVFFLLGAEMAVWAVMVPLIRLKFGWDEAELSRLLLAFGAGSILAVPAASFILKRRKHGQVTRTFGFLSLPLIGFVGVVYNVPLLFALVFAQGCLLAVTDIAMNANAVELEDEAGRPIVSSFHAWFSLGGGLGIVFGPLAQGLGLAQMGALSASLLVLAFAILQKHLLDRPVKHVEATPNRGAGWWRNIKWIIVVLALANLTAYALEGTVVDWSGVYIEKVLNAEPAQFGFGFAVFSVAMAIMRFSGDMLRARFGARLLLAVSCVTASIAYAWIALSADLLSALPGYALLGVGLANLVPILFVAAARVPGVTAGSGIALVAGLGYVGFLTFPPLVGFIAAAYGLSSVFLGLAVVAAATTLIAFAMPARPERAS
ncbi:MAG: MFS transporter, partial [Pseudomonadota bacterium]